MFFLFVTCVFRSLCKVNKYLPDRQEYKMEILCKTCFLTHVDAFFAFESS